MAAKSAIACSKAGNCRRTRTEGRGSHRQKKEIELIEIDLKQRRQMRLAKPTIRRGEGTESRKNARTFQESVATQIPQKRARTRERTNGGVGYDFQTENVKVFTTV
jgi:hypothetical protein